MPDIRDLLLCPTSPGGTLKLRHLIPCLLAASTLAACATAPLSPSEREAQQAETAKARDYFARKIQLTDDGGDRAGYTTIELKNTPTGYIVAYYGERKSSPVFTDEVTECIGKLSPSPTLDCTLFDGYHRWVGVTFTVVSEDTVVSDPRLIPLQSHIKIAKGGLLVETRHSPQSWRFAGKFVGD
ncbi:hypothetical protein [Pseudomonas sp. NA-150]|uniref:hypothetical protein n=1 Tax=Pseudomonas sp. NA-150 TaxID=3367525 RepID=UPI0037CB3396